ncbi:hypothetical protein ACN27E_07930 [Mycobacterium sp. WMMD1722]|uniref:hypothetical protein n=1 Tax=Mycobacterium sp. WMMD1722 TaxID=3404117 RepID=UPI003BF55AD3
MTTTERIPSVPLPAGADDGPNRNDDWQPAQYGFPGYRCVAFTTGEDIRCVAVQYEDGRIATEGGDAPLIYIGGSEYLPDEARKYADAIRAAVDIADHLAGVPLGTAELPRVATGGVR